MFLKTHDLLDALPAALSAFWHDDIVPACTTPIEGDLRKQCSYENSQNTKCTFYLRVFRTSEAESCSSIDSALAQFNPTRDKLKCSHDYTSSSETTNEGTSCVFSCGDGYELGNGDDDFLTCERGAWIGPAPACVESSAFFWVNYTNKSKRLCIR